MTAGKTAVLPCESDWVEDPMNPKRNPRQAGNKIQQTRRDIANLNYIIKNTYSASDIMALRNYRSFLTASLVVYLTATNVSAFGIPHSDAESDQATEQEIKNRSAEIKRFKRDVQTLGAGNSTFIDKLEQQNAECQWRRDLVKENLELRSQLADLKCYQPTGSISLEDATVSAPDDSLVLATDDNQELKNTHHHYCGFYSKTVLPPLTATVKILGKVYEVSKDLIYDIATSGKDTILTLKNTIQTKDDIPIGTRVYTSAGKLCSMITSKIDDKYLIQNGFKNINLHLTNLKVNFQTKVKNICYADKQFTTKEELVRYLESDKPKTELQATVYHRDNNEAQLVIHKDGINIVNQHLRHRIRDPQFQSREKIRDLLQQRIHDPCKLSKFKITTKAQYDIIKQLLDTEIYFCV